MEVIVLAIFPVQFPVELSVYVAFRFMKRPVLTAIGLATLSVWTLAVPVKNKLAVLRALETNRFPVTDRFAPVTEIGRAHV